MAYPYVGPVAHDSGTGNLPIHRIVVHCTAGADAKGARGTARYFRMESATGSAHAITDPNELVECAHDNVVCWHAPPNSHSLGIEICCSLANDGKGHWQLASHQQMLQRAAKWVAEKCKMHGIPVRRLSVSDLRRNANAEGICGHVDVSNAFHQSTHTDPGPYFPWSQFMALVAKEYSPDSEELSMADAQEILDYMKAVSLQVQAHTDQVLRAAVVALQQNIDAVDDEVWNKQIADVNTPESGDTSAAATLLTHDAHRAAEQAAALLKPDIDALKETVDALKTAVEALAPKA